MNVIKIENLVDEILIAVPSCPSVLAEKSLASAIRQWYEETHCWKEKLPPIECFSDVDHYLVRRDACATVLAIYSAKIKGQDIPIYFYQPETVKLMKRVSEGDQLELYAALMPHSTLTEALCDHVDRYLSKWIDGAMWHLLSMPNQIWSDLGQADYRRSMFRNSIAQERNADLSGRQYGSQSVRSNIIL